MINQNEWDLFAGDNNSAWESEKIVPVSIQDGDYSVTITRADIVSKQNELQDSKIKIVFDLELLSGEKVSKWLNLEPGKLGFARKELEMLCGQEIDNMNKIPGLLKSLEGIKTSIKITTNKNDSRFKNIYFKENTSPCCM